MRAIQLKNGQMIAIQHKSQIKNIALLRKNVVK